MKHWTIYLAYHFVQGCNFSCSYCIDPANKAQVRFSSGQDLREFVGFVLRLRELFPDAILDISLIGGEPLIDSRVFDLADRIIRVLSECRVRIQIITNGFLLGWFRERIKHFSHKWLIHFRITYHLAEYNLRDRDRGLFLNVVNILRSEQVSFQIVFLMPEESADLKEIQELIRILTIKFGSIRDIVKFEPLKTSSHKIVSYDAKIREFYEQLVRDAWFTTSFTDYGGYLLGESHLRGFRCFPFRPTTFMAVNFDLSVQFGRCSTLSRSYSLSEALELLCSGGQTGVECRDDTCPCGVLSEIYKERRMESPWIAPKLNQTLQGSEITILRCEWIRNSYNDTWLEMSVNHRGYISWIRITLAGADKGITFDGLTFLALHSQDPDIKAVFSCLFRFSPVFTKLLMLPSL